MREQYERYLGMINGYLQSLWDNGTEGVHSAMRYSLLSGGKRIRPALTLAFCELCGGKAGDALPSACAIELIHTYSLIHDDLPCMDNDDFRRGKPANHKVHGEAMALLAGDGLLTYALQLTLHCPEAAACITRAAFDMVRGQALELEGCTDTQLVYGLKTGALFNACAQAGCIIAGADAAQIDAAAGYASSLGLAFQYKDDMLDMESDCQSKVDELTFAAKNALSVFDNSGFLREFADWLCLREH